MSSWVLSSSLNFGYLRGAAEEEASHAATIGRLDCLASLLSIVSMIWTLI